MSILQQYFRGSERTWWKAIDWEMCCNEVVKEQAGVQGIDFIT